MSMGACIFPVVHSPGQWLGPCGPSSYVKVGSHFSSPRGRCKWWWSCCPCCAGWPGSAFSGGCATWRAPAGTTTNIENPRTPNASTEVLVARLKDMSGPQQSCRSHSALILCSSKADANHPSQTSALRIGVGVLDVPFTLPAASAKRRRGYRRSTCFTSGPPGRSAHHVGESECHGTTNLRRVGSDSLGQPLLVATGCRGSRSVKRSDGFRTPDRL
jgi:hypothetical protein